MCLNSVTLSLYLSITLVRARCYHNECICLMCSVGEVQEVDSRLTCYNLSCCYARKRWRVFVFVPNLLLCIYTPVTHQCWTRKPRTVILVLKRWFSCCLHSLPESPSWTSSAGYSMFLWPSCLQTLSQSETLMSPLSPTAPPLPRHLAFDQNNSNISSQMHLSFLHCLYFYLYHMINTCIIRI